MKRITSVEDYIAEHPEWSDEVRKLRKILSSTELEETMKWSAPCYTLDGKHVVGIGAFKSYVGLWFHQGALLEDGRRVLINAQEGKTKALRQWRFSSGKEIKPTWIKEYVREAIELARAGREIKPDRAKKLIVPPELEAALSRRKKARAGFDALTPGKRREYAEYIADAKREATKQTRLEKILPMLEAGTGLHDRYR